MRFSTFFLLIVSGLLVTAGVAATVFELIYDHTNVVFPSFGLVVSLRLVILVIFLSAAISFALAMLLGRKADSTKTNIISFFG